MHGLRDLNGKMDTPERLVQARRLAELVMRIAEPGDPLIVCGDFNVEPESETFAVLADIGVADLVTSLRDAQIFVSRESRLGVGT